MLVINPHELLVTMGTCPKRRLLLNIKYAQGAQPDILFILYLLLLMDKEISPTDYITRFSISDKTVIQNPESLISFL